MIDFDKRLNSLKDRRQGIKQRAILDSVGTGIESLAFLGLDSRTKEAHESLRESASIKYAIGAMAPVEKEYTKKSISEGQRVADSLIKSLSAKGIYATSRLQGSVALNIHIKGHSDVDMLIIEGGTSQCELPRVYPEKHIPATDVRRMEDIVKDLRLKSEDILPKNFPSVDVDTSKDKAIAMEKGSLSRKVDVVPSCWYNTREYQLSGREEDRGVKIYHKGNHELISNLPFKHIKLISNRDDIYSGNLRSCIRLMKNMIADMPDYKQNVVKKLSSYDIASIAYHMNEKLYMPYQMRLGLVEKIREHLDNLCARPYYRSTLYVPDGSRVIFDNTDKVEALKILNKEFSDLTMAIFKDINPHVNTYIPSTILNKKIA